MPSTVEIMSEESEGELKPVVNLKSGLVSFNIHMLAYFMSFAKTFARVCTSFNFSGFNFLIRPSLQLFQGRRPLIR